MVVDNMGKFLCFISFRLKGSFVLIFSLTFLGCQGMSPEPVLTPQFVPIVVAGGVEESDAYPAGTSSTPVPSPMITAMPTAMPTENNLPTITATPTTIPSSPMNTLPTPTPTSGALETPTVTRIPSASSTPIMTPTQQSPVIFSLGNSIEGRPIVAHQFNEGAQEIIIVGGIHGGYEWNTILLAYELIDHFVANPELIPETITLTIIPSANPDGQVLVTGKEGRFSPADVAEDSVPGRFNANNVDLNRNWDCQWQPQATWRDKAVSAGSAPFSESESVILRDFFLNRQPAAVIFLHSAANGVFAAGCPETHLESMLLAQTYGDASGYPVYERFSSYPITGDAGDWLTMQNIPTMTVELIDHYSTEFSRNLAGMLAAMDKYK